MTDEQKKMCIRDSNEGFNGGYLAQYYVYIFHSGQDDGDVYKRQALFRIYIKHLVLAFRQMCVVA